MSPEEWEREVAELRLGAKLPPAGSSLREFVAALSDLRQRLDRVEELLARTLAYRAACAREVVEARHAAEDAWDRVAVSEGKRREEFSSAKERSAQANLHTLEERQHQRRLERLLAEAEARAEQVRLGHRGLENVRADCLAMIKAAPLLSAMER